MEAVRKNVHTLKQIGEKGDYRTDKNGINNNLPRSAAIFCAEFRLRHRIGLADIVEVKERCKTKVCAEMHICLEKI